LILERSFDTNDRFVPQTTIIAPAGSEVQDGETFLLGDGANVVTFEYDSDGQVGSGRVGIAFSASDPPEAIAATIRDAINSTTVQARLRLQAVLSDGTATGTASNAERVVLFGTASGDIFVQPTGAIAVGDAVPDTGAVDDGNALRAALLGGELEPVGQADLVGGADSAGFFSDGLGTIGIDSGILLSTGSIGNAAGPNLDDNASGMASGVGDATLDGLFSVTTTDTTSLEFQFNLPTAGTGSAIPS